MKESQAESAAWKHQPVTDEEPVLSIWSQESEMAQKRRVLIVGAGGVGHLLARSLRDAGYEVVGFVDDEMDCTISGLRVLGSRADIERIVCDYRVDEIIAYHRAQFENVEPLAVLAHPLLLVNNRSG